MQMTGDKNTLILHDYLNPVPRHNWLGEVAVNVSNRVGKWEDWEKSPALKLRNYMRQWAHDFGSDDEGFVILTRIINYLDATAEDDEWLDGRELAADLLRDCQDMIKREYGCIQCGKPLGRKHSYCSAPCAKADREEL